MDGGFLKKKSRKVLAQKDVIAKGDGREDEEEKKKNSSAAGGSFSYQKNF